jgi:hypothetical protein
VIVVLGEMFEALISVPTESIVTGIWRHVLSQMFTIV